MSTATRIAQSRLIALERENRWLRQRVEWLVDEVREVRGTVQLIADDCYQLGTATSAARTAFHALQEREKQLTQHFRRTARRRRA